MGWNAYFTGFPPREVSKIQGLMTPLLITLRDRLAALRGEGKKVVFTNGCFDLLHPGHLRLLTAAKGLGDCLVVGLNSDASTRALKGPGRPILPEAARAELLRGLKPVDEVALFDEATPLELILALAPHIDVLVKGADYGAGEIVGEPEVTGWGGRVERVPLAEGFSTSAIEGKIITAAREAGKK
jgi:D-beta-D-heptose 7-phosphate kinase/D-beta-D-heptose 1-phosphate adenosyltransferase